MQDYKNVNFLRQQNKKNYILYNVIQLVSFPRHNKDIVIDSFPCYDRFAKNILLEIMSSHVSYMSRSLDDCDYKTRNYHSQKINVTPFQSRENTEKIKLILRLSILQNILVKEIWHQGRFADSVIAHIMLNKTCN